MLMIIYIAGIALFAWLFYSVLRRKKKGIIVPPQDLGSIFARDVKFYQQLSVVEQAEFVERANDFLQRVAITGVNTQVQEVDRAYVAAGAIIPIFKFKNWRYQNINEVLLYPEAFNTDYQQKGKDRNVLGLVGEGPMQRVMILSQPVLRSGFTNETDVHNTAIHEFVHLIDKSDGDTDGRPDAVLPHQYSLPWLKKMHQEMQEIREGASDINPYGTTNEAEFLAVAAEYFFEQPEKMQEKHPELHKLLTKMFVPAQK